MGDERLTRAEAEAIFRRAAEIEATQVDADLDMAQLEEIAGEAGLSRQAVRQAALELRTGGVGPPAQPKLLGPRTVAASRTVDVPSERVTDGLDAWLEREQMRVRRRLEGRTTWERATGLTAGIVRAVDLNKVLRLKDVSGLVVDVVDLGEGRTHVRVELDFSAFRGGWLGGLGTVVGVGGAALAVGLGAATGGGLLLGEAIALAGGAVGVGGAAGGVYAAGKATMRSRQDAAVDAVHGVLDEIEAGAIRRPRTRRRR